MASGALANSLLPRPPDVQVRVPTPSFGFRLGLGRLLAPRRVPPIGLATNDHRKQTLLKHNASASGWGQIQQENGIVAFCLEDVNLRLWLLVVWQNNKPYIGIDLLYASTRLSSFSIPIGVDKDMADILTDVLQAVVAKIESSGRSK